MSYPHNELFIRNHVARANSQRRRWIHGVVLVVGLVLLMQGTSAAQIGPVNVALGKRAMGSLPCTPLSGADNAVDGGATNIFTDKWCSLAPNKWLRVDLGATYQLESFVVVHAGAAGESTRYNTRDYTIKTSRDGQLWTTAVIVVGNTLNTTVHHLGPLGVSARYIDLNVTAPEQSTLAGLGGAARIYELEAYARVG
jgi:hypothetical protein